MKKKLHLILLVFLPNLIVNGQIISTVVDSLAYPSSIVVDTSGYIYTSSWIADNLIRKINITTGAITIIAGTPTPGYNGDGIAATTAQLNLPFGIAIDDSANLYIADVGNFRIRKINKITGLISTIAGTGITGYNGDGILATSAQLKDPQFVAVDPAGNVYISDIGDSPRIRKIDKITGLISTIVGTGVAGFNGDGILATTAQIMHPEEIAFDEFGNVIFFDDENYRFRMVTTTTGIISTIAGTGVSGYTGDGGLATSAEIGDCEGLDVDTCGNIYFSDGNANNIRKIDKSSGIINLFAGGGTSGLGDGGPAISAQLNVPTGIVIDQFSNMFIADFGNDRIRKITGLSNCYNSIEEKIDKIKIDFFPNPFNKTATLVIKSEKVKIENADLKLTDIFGRTVKVVSNINKKEILLERENLETGIYFYQLINNDRVIATGKFIVN